MGSAGWKIQLGFGQWSHVVDWYICTVQCSELGIPWVICISWIKEMLSVPQIWWALKWNHHWYGGTRYILRIDPSYGARGDLYWVSSTNSSDTAFKEDTSIFNYINIVYILSYCSSYSVATVFSTADHPTQVIPLSSTVGWRGTRGSVLCFSVLCGICIMKCQALYNVSGWILHCKLVKVIEIRSHTNYNTM